MHRLARAALLSAGLLLAAAPLAHAGSSTMSYQGVLTDGLGNLVPDGNYTLTFTIYDAPAGPTALWTETHVGVPVTKGGFSVGLGNTTPVNVPFYSFLNYFLGIQVGADPELTPRIQLTGAPSAMALGMIGDNLSLAGEASWYPSASGFGNGGGGFMHLYQLSSGSIYANLEPDFSGDGLWAYFGGYGNSYVNWDGDNGAAEGTFTVSGTFPTLISPGASGNAAVQVPADAIASAEVLDEPGIASNHAAAFSLIGSVGTGASTDLVSVSLTTPAPGYVVVSGDFQLNLYDPDSRAAWYQISETSGAGINYNYYFLAGPDGATFGGWMPCAIHRVLYKPVAGNYTFYLQASNYDGTDAAYFNPTLTAHFVPTSYGAVTTIASAEAAATFERATPVAASPGATQPTGTGYSVDLRELELRVRREEARLAESRLQLQQARMKEQQEKSVRAAAMRRGAVGAAAPAPKEER